MYEIGKREFINLFKSFKSITIVVLILTASFYSAKFSRLFEGEAKDFNGTDIQYLGLLVLIVLFGTIFIMSLSHDTISREIHERTIRFLVTKTSRASIILGKFFGILLFWVICLFTSFILIGIFTQRIDWFIFFQTMSSLTFQIALTILVSVLVPKPMVTMFLGTLIGILFPILGFWLMTTERVWAVWIKYITPFYYLEQPNFSFLVIFLFSAILLLIASFILNRRDC
ncbi:ABC transporter permease [Bacillus massilinigeriensis]|uniref:ABC transporter permease n=1 Tax=Bacillus mediterraneensis TaxID=1805474 RepID=UPI0008F7F7CD|nr:ABC transporter permease subunit [Bacillus mediterraneensis]